MVGTVSYGAVHDDPLPFVVGVLLAFPTSVMFALSSASRESRAGY